MRASSLLASLCFFVFASAAPPPLARRVDNSPGLGMELELRQLSYANPRKETLPPPLGQSSPDHVTEDAVVAAHTEYSNPPKKLKIRDPEVQRDHKRSAKKTDKPSPQTWNTCHVWSDGDWYGFNIVGKYFDPTKFGENGSGLKKAIEKCGVLTKWNYETKDKDPSPTWSVTGHLPPIPAVIRPCVGKAVISAGGQTADQCIVFGE